jgi:predicted nuclease of predicted toxin-antitoxin system
MSLKLYFDVHVRAAVTDGLRMRGIDVLTAQEDGAATMDDPDLLDRAGVLGRVVFTQDQDFLREAHRRQASGESFIGVIYGHQLHVTVGQCVADLELLAKIYELEDMAHTVEYLPLK